MIHWSMASKHAKGMSHIWAKSLFLPRYCFISFLAAARHLRRSRSVNWG